MTIISSLNVGFSVVSAAILFCAYAFSFQNINKSWVALSSCAALLTSLSALQVWHLNYLYHGTDLFSLTEYRFWLFLVPPTFFLFSRAFLMPDARNSPLLLLNLTPLLLVLIPDYETAIPMIFLIGTGYSFWIATMIYGLRAQRRRFQVEMSFFVFFAVMAVFVLLMGLAIPYIDHAWFYLFYMNSIAFAFMLIVAALLVFPDMLSELALVSRLSYARSTLGDVDVESRLARLDDLMREKRLFQNENLSLAMTAEAMELTSHQLSELINVHFGMGFPRYIRKQRVEAAKTLLANEPESSILAISLETGFRSQSNFYAAFREITGLSPGDYRKHRTGE